jgi:hypothetical protein
VFVREEKIEEYPQEQKDRHVVIIEEVLV